MTKKLLSEREVSEDHISVSVLLLSASGLGR